MWFLFCYSKTGGGQEMGKVTKYTLSDMSWCFQDSCLWSNYFVATASSLWTKLSSCNTVPCCRIYSRSSRSNWCMHLDRVYLWRTYSSLGCSLNFACQSACYIPRCASWSIITFNVTDFYWNLLTFQCCLKSYSNNGHSTWRHAVLRASVTELKTPAR
jgi:hypothetical protein